MAEPTKDGVAALVRESIYDTADDYAAAERLVDRLNRERAPYGERFGVVETRAWNAPVRTVNRYLIVIRKASRG